MPETTVRYRRPRGLDRICGSCRWPLTENRGPDGERRWVHGSPLVVAALSARTFDEGIDADHDADPIDWDDFIEEFGLDHANIGCDFCAVTNPGTWIYPCRDFEVVPGSGEIMRGDWVACEDCRDLIENQKWDVLAARSVTEKAASKAEDPQWAEVDDVDDIEQGLRLLWHKYTQYRIGSPWRIGDTWEPPTPAADHSEALEEHLALISWWETTDAQRFAIDLTNPASEGALENESDRSLRLRAEVATATPALLNISETVYVTDEMCELVASAAESIPEGTTFERSDLPLMAGIACLGGTVPFTDRAGYQHQLGAVSWYPIEKAADYSTAGAIPTGGTVPFDEADGILVATYTDGPSYHELTSTRAAGRLPRYHFFGWNVMQYGDEIGGLREPAATFARAFLFALGRLMQETLVSTAEPVRVHKHTRRRAERVMTSRPDPGEVTVVHLRRTVSDGDGKSDGVGEGRTLTYRHIRRGHWAHVSCKCHPPVDDRGYGRHVTWRRPTVVGPDDAPLVVRDRVYKVDR